MIDVQEGKDVYVAQFERIEEASSRNGQAWLLPIRRAAMARFVELGFPTTKHEEWRSTNVARIANTVFELENSGAVDVSRGELEPFTFGDSAGGLVVFVNGRFAPELSLIPRLPDGVKVGSLAEAMQTDPGLVEPHLARHACYQQQPFTALNTAFMEDGAFVYVPKGKVVVEPIHLLFLTTASERALVTHPRNLIVAEPSSQVTVVETYAGLGDGVYFTNAVTEIIARENSVIDHYKIVREGGAAFHMATLQLHQERSSTVDAHTVCLGGILVRNDINTVLDGEGCECTLNGLYLVIGKEHVDNHLVVDHASPHCNSREFFKGILDGHGRGVFSGRIIVRKDAQKTDAKQTNRSLLLSQDARVESKPQLEILANDVKCTHGATIGQVSEEALFYLRSRGLSKEAARSLLVFAFAGECLDRVRIKPLRAQLETLLLARLPQGNLLREAV